MRRIFSKGQFAIVNISMQLEISMENQSHGLNVRRLISFLYFTTVLKSARLADESHTFMD